MSKQEEDERLKNLIIYKAYLTDEELKEALPMYIITLIVFFSGLFVYIYFC